MNRQKKHQVKKKRVAVNYEDQPPVCKSCIFYEHGIKAKGTTYQMRCSINEFGVNPNAVCDLWKNKQGETIRF